MMLLLDIIVAALLGATIFFSWRLSRNIRTIRQSRSDLSIFLNDFNDAITRAELCIIRLREMDNEVGREIRSNIDKARFLSNDLAFLIQKGAEVADSIEGGIKSPGNPAKKPVGSSNNEFTKRAADISSGQAIKAFENVVAEREKKDKAASKRKAVEQAMAEVARRNAEIKALENAQALKKTEVTIVQEKSEVKQRSLFDALRWTRQLQ